MEFNEKLQQLRKRKGITQEELAQYLYVSRAAVSKWESGRGYPNIDSLKSIARFYEITIDDLLSGEELLTIAEEDSRQKESAFSCVTFGLLDCSYFMLLFLPFFGNKTENGVEAVNLLSLSMVSSWLPAVYYLFLITMIAAGILNIAMHGRNDQLCSTKWQTISSLLNAVGVMLFTVTLQPYAAVFMFLFLIIKVLILLKWR